MRFACSTSTESSVRNAGEKDFAIAWPIGKAADHNAPPPCSPLRTQINAASWVAFWRRRRRAIVMIEKGRTLLRSVHDVPQGKVAVVPHGAPNRPLRDTAAFKQSLGLSGPPSVADVRSLVAEQGHRARLFRPCPRSCANIPTFFTSSSAPRIRISWCGRARATAKACKPWRRDLGVAEACSFLRRIHDHHPPARVHLRRRCLRDALSQRIADHVGHALLRGRSREARGLDAVLACARALSGGKGILVPFNDPAAIGAAVTNLLGNPQLLDETPAARVRGRP